MSNQKRIDFKKWHECKKFISVYNASLCKISLWLTNGVWRVQKISSTLLKRLWRVRFQPIVNATQSHWLQSRIINFTLSSKESFRQMLVQHVKDVFSRTESVMVTSKGEAFELCWSFLFGFGVKAESRKCLSAACGKKLEFALCAFWTTSYGNLGRHHI